VGGHAALSGGTPGMPDPTAAPSREDVNLLALRSLPGVGDRVAGRLLREAASRGAALERVRNGGPGVPRPAREAWAVSSARFLEMARETARRAAAAGIRILGVDDPRYPPLLQRLHDPPAVLYLRGRTELLERPALALVGSRRATASGRRVAERLARELSEAGWAVVSGLALGIDAAAHRGAVAGRGGTVAVLGRGPDRAYPLAHADLFHQIARDGLLVSEFPPGIPASAHNFPRRNRVLAALCHGVVVVEAARRSGALLTVDHALDMGIEVMAVPGPADADSTEGSNALIADGAPGVNSAEDVLRHLEGHLPGGVRDRLTLPGPRHGALSGGSDEERVMALLAADPCTLDLLVEQAGIPLSRVLAALSRLDLARRVRREPEGWILLPSARAVSRGGLG
jgi:DNA processing protein